MKDERYVFIQDVKEKKAIGRSSFNKRTHAGGSGKKKWAAELMTKKELEKMNGELKTYRLNDPMTWEEFKALPDDIKKMYIKAIQEKFNPFDASIAKTLFGVHPSTFLDVLKRLGMCHGNVDQRRQWDKAGFEAWARGEKPTEAYQSLPKPTEEKVVEVTEAKVEYTEKKKAVPKTGRMDFEGTTEEIIETIASLLGGAEIKLTITWGLKAEGDKWL